MKIGIVINTNEPETAWNAFRFGVKALEKGHSAAVFLLGKGVEIENLQDSEFGVQEAISAFQKRNGTILACGTCWRSRGKGESNVCSISTMAELLKLVEESDHVLTFG